MNAGAKGEEPTGDEPQSGSLAVVGSAGFVGSYIALAAEEAGLATSRISRQTHGDFLEAARSWFAPRTTVVYAAGTVPQRRPSAEDWDKARRSFLSVLRASRQSQQFVLVSSASVYGTASATPRSERESPTPDGEYGRYCAAMEAEAVSKLGADRVLIARPFNIFGPGGRGLVDTLMSTRAPILVGRQSVRDYVHVAEVARAIVHLRARTGAYNIGTGRARSNEDIVRACLTARPELASLVEFQDVANTDASVADTSRLRRAGIQIEDTLEQYTLGGAR